MSTLSLRKIKHDSSAVDNITLDSNGQVGINVTPTAPLTVGRVSSVNEGGQIDLCRSTDNASAWGIDVYGSTSTPSLRIIDNVAAAVRMQIDGSGRVIMPSQPAFSASSTGTQVLSTTGDHQINSTYGGLSTILLNTGGYFDSSTGRFTAPIAGRYVLQASMACSFSSGYCYFYIIKNGSSYDGGYRNFAQSAQYIEQSINNVLSLNAGDYVELRITNNYTGGAIYGPMFSGYLLG